MTPNLTSPSRAPRALFIGSVWPEPRSTAAGHRTTNVLEILRDEGWETHFATAATRGERGELPSGVQAREIALNSSTFDEWVKALAPELIVFDRFFSEEQFGWRARDAAPGALLVLDTSDLHFLRHAREHALPDSQAATTDVALRELASILRCDLTWVVSDFERALLVEKLGVRDELVDVSRILYTPPPAPPAFANRAGFLSIGNFQHAPNGDAVRWLHAEVWPRIRKRIPQATLRICGSYVSKEFSQLHDPRNGFLIEGFVPSATDALAEARVSLAALRFGAGIKGKILDSWWAGTPVVTTPIGAEGMTGPGRFPGAVAATADLLAERAVALHEHETLWQEASGHGLDLIRSRYLQAPESLRLGRLLRHFIQELPARRERHWLGRVLHSQTVRSTEYFSRWIEEKSRYRNPNSGNPTDTPALREK